MSNFNKVIVIGNLTADPELVTLPSGSQVANLRMAVNEKYRGRDGETVENTVFIDVKFFGRTAEVCQQYLSKGRPLMVEGSLRQDHWEDKETGGKRSKIYIFGRKMIMLPGGRGRGDTNTGGRGTVAQPKDEFGGGSSNGGDFDDFGPVSDDFDDF